MKDAMKSKDEKTLRALRAIKAPILLAKTAEGGTGQLAEAHEVKMLLRQRNAQLGSMKK